MARKKNEQKEQQSIPLQVVTISCWGLEEIGDAWHWRGTVVYKIGGVLYQSCYHAYEENHVRVVVIEETRRLTKGNQLVLSPVGVNVTTRGGRSTPGSFVCDGFDDQVEFCDRVVIPFIAKVIAPILIMAQDGF